MCRKGDKVIKAPFGIGVRILGAQTIVHHTKQAHKTHTNDPEKRPKKIVFSMVLNQRRMTQHEVPIKGEHAWLTCGYHGWCTRGPWMKCKRSKKP